MHDYQLERLNTRSFEQLVQSLSVAVLGHQVQIFGDGPDGGREASFHGGVAYPAGATPWNGSGIVQAKFRQQPDASPKKNADWALSQLKAEFKKLKARKPGSKPSPRGSRVCPDYYVFATNLSLSAVAQTGGKDRISAALDGFKKSHGLKDWALWDGDQIRRFLEVHEGIRMSYSAWLLPGDVLAAMMKHLKLERTDFPATMRRYLEAELLDDQYAKLGQGGYTESNSIPLSNVFVDLPVAPSGYRSAASTASGPVEQQVVADEPEFTDEDSEGVDESANGRRTFLRLFFEEGRQVLRPSAQPPRHRDERRAHRVPGRIVLVGGPGQGKTTVGQFACQLLRAALLRSTSALYSEDVRGALERIERQARGLPPPNVLRYPLRVDLKRLAEALADTGPRASNSLLDFLVKHVERRTDSGLSKSEFRTWLHNWPWLLVLDGLDEVPASSNRALMMDAIRDFIASEAQAQDADLLVLATTRPQGYSDEFDPEHFLHLDLLPLEPNDAMQYGTRLAEARHPGGRGRVEELTSALRLATENDSTKRLMVSPLQVTIMLALIEGGGVPPEHRWKLFHDYYGVIYRREKERGTPFSKLLGRLEPDFHWIHHRAGWLLQQRNAATGKTATKLDHKEFQSLVNRRLLDRGHKDDHERGALVREIVEAATNRLVLLVGNTAEEIGFEIRSLQEFMAAEHAFDGVESSLHETLGLIAPHAYWRNVFLFVAGRIFFEKETIVDSLIAICHRLNENSEDPTAQMLAVGSRLAVAMLEDGASRNQPNNTRMLARLAAKLLDQSDAGAAVSLQSHFAGDSLAVLREELRSRIGSGHAKPGAWRLCLRLADEGKTWASDDIHRALKQAPPRSGAWLKELIFLEWESTLLRQVIAANPLQLPTYTLAHLLDRDGHAGQKLLLSGPLAGRLPTLLDYSRSTGLTILDSRGRVGPISLGRRSADVLGVIEQLQLHGSQLATADPQWRAMHIASEFARQPNLSNLASQAQALLALPPEDVPRWFLPWQLIAAVDAGRAGMPATEIAARARAGKLGQSADWLRWSRITELRLADLGRPDGLLSAADGALGAVFVPSLWNMKHEDAQGHLAYLGDLARALKQVPLAREDADRLARVCGTAIRLSSDELGAELVVPVLRALIEGCRHSGATMASDVLGAIVSMQASEADLLALFLEAAPLVRRDGDHYFFHTSDGERMVATCERLYERALREGHAEAFLYALSLLPMSGIAKRVPASLLGSLEAGAEKHVQAALLLRLARLDWLPDEAPALATVYLQHKPAEDLGLLSFLEYMERQSAAGSHIEALLIRLATDTGASGLDADNCRRCVEQLLQVHDRRPAPEVLPDPTVRTDGSG